MNDVFVSESSHFPRVLALPLSIGRQEEMGQGVRVRVHNLASLVWCCRGPLPEGKRSYVTRTHVHKLVEQSSILMRQVRGDFDHTDVSLMISVRLV